MKISGKEEGTSSLNRAGVLRFPQVVDGSLRGLPGLWQWFITGQRCRAVSKGRRSTGRHPRETGTSLQVSRSTLNFSSNGL